MWDKLLNWQKTAQDWFYDNVVVPGVKGITGWLFWLFAVVFALFAVIYDMFSFLGELIAQLATALGAMGAFQTFQPNFGGQDSLLARINVFLPVSEFFIMLEAIIALWSIMLTVRVFFWLRRFFLP